MLQCEQKSPDQISGEIIISFPDGAQRQFNRGVTGFDIAQTISPSLAKRAIAVKLNGHLCDVMAPIWCDGTIEIVDRDHQDALGIIRHDTAHIMAEAVQMLYPQTQVTIGPAIENGFYYDFYRETPFSTDDLKQIEDKMREIMARDEKFVREEWERADAVQFFRDKGELFKVELIESIPGDEKISIYRQGNWLDLCRGPHVPSTGKVGTAFKLMNVAGAYWRGDSNRPMLQRIYGTAWRTQKDLDSYLHMLEEAERRDHRKLGKEMGLFHLQDEAQGSVFWHPKGWAIWIALETYLRKRLRDAGYQEVKTPQLMDSRFWEASGHWGKYRENMFVVPDVVPNTDEVGKIFKEDPKKFLALKPMNCPAHVQIFKQGIKSYRDLPLRLAEFGCCHRNEAHGALHGLLRVRQFTQDDAHIFCREDQIMDECVKFCELTKSIYSDLGFENYVIKLETRPEKRIGSDELWDKAEAGLEQALQKLGMNYTISPGDGAFYGPKLAFIIRDAIGREWGCGTIQLDFNLPERLDALYTAEDGSRQRPVMLHRAVLGSIERWIGIMIEHYAGKLPLWLAPVQVVVATITDAANEYAQSIVQDLKSRGIRAELDLRNEKIGYKIREHSVAKTPILAIIGQKEAENDQIVLRYLSQEDQLTLSRADALARISADTKMPE
ncbi:MAG: threonine--tRNA ligase [Alphaproteobacteria bacterium]|nr:threonine--tRNA ligase [Alphaproteobacteria bacterium]